MHASRNPLWNAVNTIDCRPGRAACGAWATTASAAAIDWWASALGPAGMGSGRNALMIRGAYDEAKIEPKTATPSVPPSSRVVLLTPAAAPRCSSATEPITASAVGAVMEERPRASSTMATTIGPQYAVPASELKAATTNPPPMSSSPTVTTRRVPTLRATTAAIGVHTAATMANGSVCRPADSVEYPLTNWKYWVMRKMKPKRQKNATEMDSAPPVKRGILKTRTSSSGPSVRSSNRAKTVSRTAAVAKQASVPIEAQPHCGPSMMASTNSVIPTVEITTPRMSKRCSATLGSRGIRNPPATIVTRRSARSPGRSTRTRSARAAPRRRSARRPPRCPTSPPRCRAPSAARMGPGRRS